MKLKFIVLIFFVAATNFVFAESKSVEHYKRLIEKWGPVPSVFLKAYKRQKPELNTAGEVISEIYDFILRFWSVRKRSAIDNVFEDCSRNQIILIGALKMYNLDHSEAIDNIIVTGSDNTFQLLISNGYLESTLHCPEGIYKNYGPYSKDGFLYCEHHGPLSQHLPRELLLAADLIKPDPLWVQVFQVVVVAVGFGTFILLLFKLVQKFVEKRPEKPIDC
jgi:hypothetical protein